MKKLLLICALMLGLVFTQDLQATNSGPIKAGTGLFFAAPTATSLSTSTSPFIFGKKKKKKTFAAGLVVGGPTGIGARVIFRPSRLGVALDGTFSKIRTDAGPKVDAFTVKADARMYSKGLLAKLLRTYMFGGVTMSRGKFDESQPETVMRVDAGIGGGIKLWRLSFNAEAGLLVPIKGVPDFTPGLDVFGSIAIMWWLF